MNELAGETAELDMRLSDGVGEPIRGVGQLALIGVHDRIRSVPTRVDSTNLTEST